MAVANIKVEGTAQVSICAITCVCQCGNHDRTNGTIEFNFGEQKVFYTCSVCKKINEMAFGKDKPPPYPRIRQTR